MNVISEPLKMFPSVGKLLNFNKIETGHINETYHIETETGHFLLQSLSPVAFKNPDAVMSNISGVTKYIEKKMISMGKDATNRCLRLIPTSEGKTFWLDENGRAWRMYNYIFGKTFDSPTSNELFKKSGKGFGKFQSLLAGYPSETLFETIPHFHDTPDRYKKFCVAVEENKSGRLSSCRDLVDFVNKRKDKLSVIVDGLADGSIPLRISHNDTKLNNIIFDLDGKEPLCVLDLDTVMPGSALYDFGDSIRFGANTAAEDEKNLDKVKFDLYRFAAYVDGFMEGCGKDLTEKEISLFFYSSWLITLECGMRFLTDYLDGDVYFHTDYDDHNLDRAKNQFALVADMEKKEAEAQHIVSRYLKK